MKTITEYIQQFLFEPISAKGFSIMRILWATIELITYCTHWFYYDVYYSTSGILGPIECTTLSCRLHSYIFAEPTIHITFALLCTALFCTLVGYKPRFTVLISLLLIVCFHERNPMIMNGGDRIEKYIAFLLIIAPNMHMYAVSKSKYLYNSIWVQRLLLWQLVILYATAGIHKLEVGGWLNGRKLGLSLHLEQFTRFPVDTFSWLQPWLVPMSFYVVAVQIAWLGMLIPHHLRAKFLWRQWPFTLKQTIMLGTASMHIGIMITMNVEMFPIVMLIAYVGLLRESDFQDLTRFYKKIRSVCGFTNKALPR